MGAWGAGSFDNDSALDWYDDFRAAGAGAVRSAFDAAGTEDDIDVDDGTAAIAAAEIVAAVLGRPLEEPPADFDVLVSRHAAGIKEMPEIGDAAIAAVRRIRTEPSELYELWLEGGDDHANEWLAVVDELIERLQKDR